MNCSSRMISDLSSYFFKDLVGKEWPILSVNIDDILWYKEL